MHLLYNFPALLLIILSLGACSSEDDLDFPQPNIPVPPTLLEVISPTNGATLTANQPFTLEYDVVRGSKGAYVEIQVNDDRPIIVDKTHGMHYMEPLPPGRHTLRLTVRNRDKDKQPGTSPAIIHITMR